MAVVQQHNSNPWSLIKLNINGLWRNISVWDLFEWLCFCPYRYGCLGAGVAACYRGYRLYDTNETKALVTKWVNFYKKYRPILIRDIIHVRALRRWHSLSMLAFRFVVRICNRLIVTCTSIPTPKMSKVNRPSSVDCSFTLCCEMSSSGHGVQSHLGSHRDEFTRSTVLLGLDGCRSSVGTGRSLEKLHARSGLPYWFADQPATAGNHLVRHSINIQDWFFVSFSSFLLWYVSYSNGNQPFVIVSWRFSTPESYPFSQFYQPMSFFVKIHSRSSLCHLLIYTSIQRSSTVG